MSIPVEKSNVISLADRAPSRKITAGRDLFTWTWRQLEQAQPKIAVSEYVVADLDQLFRSIRAGRSMVYPPIEWMVLFAEIRWDNVYDRNGHHCALALLEVVGRLCETLMREGGGRVPHIRACEMMQSYWDRAGNYIHYKYTRSGIYLVSTPACEQTFGVQVKVRLTDAPLNDIEWTLQGSSDWG